MPTILLLGNKSQARVKKLVQLLVSKKKLSALYNFINSSVQAMNRVSKLINADDAANI